MEPLNSSATPFAIGRIVRGRFLLAWVAAAAVLSVVILVLYRQDAELERVVLEQQAQHVVELQRELLLSEFRAVQSDLLVLADQELLTRALSGSDEALAELMRAYQSFAANKAVYDQVRCLDPSGQELVRVNYRDGIARIVPKGELQPKGDRYYVQAAHDLDAGEVFVSPFDLNVEHGRIEEPIRPVIRFITPVSGADGARSGYVVLNYLGARLLSQLERVADGFPGDTMLVNADGEYLRAPKGGRAWGWLLGHDASFRRDYQELWQRLPGEASPTVTFVDGRVAVSEVTLAWDGEAYDRHERLDSTAVLVLAEVSNEAVAAQSRVLLGRLMLVGALAMTIVTVSLLYWARSSVERQSQAQRIKESESRLRHLSRLLLAAHETERRSISRDLHDDLGQQVTAIGLDLRSLRAAEGAKGASPRLDAAIAGTDRLLRDLHEIATRVRPSVLDDLGLEEAVESLLADYEQRTGVEVDSTLRVDGTRISPMVGENAYRILQEALANVAKHSKSLEARVRLTTSKQSLDIEVVDRGRGFDPNGLEGSGRLGILGMRERVELLGGRFHIESGDGRGTAIEVALPLGDPART